MKQYTLAICECSMGPHVEPEENECGAWVYAEDALALQARIAELEALAYIGDHHFPDLTWKARVAELEAERNRDATQLDQLGIALLAIQRMTEELANSKYAKAAGGDTLGAEIHRIATEALTD